MIRLTGDQAAKFYAEEVWDGQDDLRRFEAVELANATEDVGLLRAALRTAVHRLSAYQLECRHLDAFLKEGHDPRGFCKGTIFEFTFADIISVLNGGPER